jgi:hypothetical protein
MSDFDRFKRLENSFHELVDLDPDGQALRLIAQRACRDAGRAKGP